MNTEEFVNSIKHVVRDSTISGVISLIECPPGRSPKKNLLELSKYYQEKNDEEKKIIREIIQLSTDNAIFGFLCVLDGVREFDDVDKGKLSLIYTSDNKKCELNENEDLHDYYNAE